LGGEQGLLSIAFHPSYNTNRYFFVWYTGVTGAVTLARYRRDAVNPDIADPTSGQVLLTIPKPGSPYFTNHNGGKLNFGTDGFLYVGTGDGGSGGDPFNNAQDLTSLRGKMLRLDVNSFATSAPLYDIPATNPYLVQGDNIRDEIYAYGLRNPWRWSFDRSNGDMWIADVGQGLWEEVNYRPAGSTAGLNYGWRCYEGAHIYSGGGCTPSDTISPIFEYGHNNATGGYSITGGYVYRGSEFSALQGYYMTADYVSGNFWLVWPDGSGGFNSYQQPPGIPGNIDGFGEAADGTVYALQRSTGTLYKVVVTGVLPVTLSRFYAVGKNGYNELAWSSSSEINSTNYFVEYSSNGLDFKRVGMVSASGAGDYDFRHTITRRGDAWYRLAIADANGSVRYSNIVRVKNIGGNAVEVFPTIVSNGRFQVNVNEPVKSLQLINSSGAVVFTKNMQGLTGVVPVELQALPKGVYVLRVNGDKFAVNERMVIE
ncbi:MAG: PQQ-dependent sugar dehydrogenase, partial [Panacibacter sp.]